MGVVARTDSEAATLITTNIDERDHSSILRSTNPDQSPLVKVLQQAECRGLQGPELQVIEDKWIAEAGLALFSDVLITSVAKYTKLPTMRVEEFREAISKLSIPDARKFATQAAWNLPQSSIPFWGWDIPERYYRFRDGTECVPSRCAVRRFSLDENEKTLYWRRRRNLEKT